METFTMSDAFATLAVRNRLPQWSEYVQGSPCDKRAIIARWHEIANEDLTFKYPQPFSNDDISKYGRDFMEQQRACGFLIRAGEKTPYQKMKEAGTRKHITIIDLSDEEKDIQVFRGHQDDSEEYAGERSHRAQDYPRGEFN
jgi:hypothetical protein